MKKRFKFFLDKNLKTKNYCLQAYIDDLVLYYANTGNYQYELSKFETKNGQTILFDYTVEELKNYYKTELKIDDVDL